MRFRKKPIVIEAITFAELVQHGKANADALVSGVPWSFKYKGHAITHESDECYLIQTSEGMLKFTPADMLITGVGGETYPCKPDIFEASYEPADPVVIPPTPLTEKGGNTMNKKISKKKTIKKKSAAKKKLKK